MYDGNMYQQVPTYININIPFFFQGFLTFIQEWQAAPELKRDRERKLKKVSEIIRKRINKILNIFSFSPKFT